jgi:hypothetical protein
MTAGDYALRGVGVVIGLLPAGKAAVRIGGKVLDAAVVGGSRVLHELGLGGAIATHLGSARGAANEVAGAVGVVVDGVRPQTIRDAEEVAAEVERLGTSLADSASKGRAFRRFGAEEANRTLSPFYKDPPFRAGTQVVQFLEETDHVYVRVHGADNQIGRFMMNEQAIRGMTAREIQVKYALPYTPTHISEVVVPKGTKLWWGRVASNAYGNAGAIQYYLIETLPKASYRGIKPLP